MLVDVIKEKLFPKKVFVNVNDRGRKTAKCERK